MLFCLGLVFLIVGVLIRKEIASFCGLLMMFSSLLTYAVQWALGNLV